MNTTTLCLMLKAPQPGFVKTRLAKDVGDRKAAEIYRALVERQISHIPEGWDVAIHFTPADARREMRMWLEPHLNKKTTTFIPQPKGNLTPKLQFAMKQSFEAGAVKVLFAGGDCPALTRERLVEAEHNLSMVDIVIIPAQDGGYVLLGTKTADDFLFENIEWGTERVFPKTLEVIQKRNLTRHIFETLEDVDDKASLLRAGWRNLHRRVT